MVTGCVENAVQAPWNKWLIRMHLPGVGIRWCASGRQACSMLHEGPANWSRVDPHLGPGSQGMTVSERLAREACQSTMGGHLCLCSLFLSKCFKGNQETGWQPHEVFEFMATKVFGEPMKPRAVFSDVVGIPSPIVHQALNHLWGAVIRGKFRNGHLKTDF